MSTTELNDKVYFCPQCGSAAVNYSEIGGAAKCEGCHWIGERNQLGCVPISHEFANSGDMVISMMRDLRQVLSGELGLPYLRFLLKWGFVSADQQDIAGTLDRKLFSRYLAAIGSAVLKALFEERHKIERERVLKENPHVAH